MTITRSLGLAILLAVVGLWIATSDSAVYAANAGDFYRYPWSDGEVRPRTQGQFGAPSHTVTSGLQYAVDWASVPAETVWTIYAAAEGTATCYPRFFGGTSGSFGRWFAVYNGLANETAIYAHKNACDVAGELTSFAVRQGQTLGLIGNLGCTAPCTHLHFQVNDGNNQTGALISSPFAMSGISGFRDSENPAECRLSNAECVQDGPSDNAGVGYVQLNPDQTDLSIMATYTSAGGWWNVGATYYATTDSGDEWGG